MTKRLTFWIVRVSIASALACASFFVGGAVGFQLGREFQSGQSAATDSVGTTADLQRLRAGDTAPAVASLESRLDGYLLAHGLSVLEEGFLSAIWLLNSPYGDRLARKAAEYRTEHPSEADDPGVRGTVNAIASCLVQSSNELSDPELRVSLRQCYRHNW